MNTWFTADLHFGHSNIIKYCNRPFVDEIEMNSLLISNFNSVIKSNDTVYCLGDFSFQNPLQFLKKLNGNWNLIRGNHDSKQSHGFVSDKDIHLLKNVLPNVHIFMSHYSHQAWPHSHHGSIHLFGHSHGKLKGIGRSFDIGVDTNNFFPYSLEQVIEISKTLKPVVAFGKDPLTGEYYE